MKTIEKKWTQIAKANLEGRTIRTVRYMTAEEASESMWSQRPLIIIFDDGNYIIPMQDDEGNGGGALSTSFDDIPVIGVI